MTGPSVGETPVAPTGNGSAAPSEPPRVPRGIDPRALGRVPEFDGLRGFTVIIVFVSHLQVILPIPTLAVVPGGTVSLDSFFVLSGFLITSIMLREQARTGGVAKWGFYRRRAIRLLPPLLALLVAQMIFAYLTYVDWHLEWQSLLSVGFYYENYKLALNSNVFGGQVAPGLQHLWSLSVEEQFYMIWPWVTVFFLTIRTRLRTVVIVLCSLIFLIFLNRWHTYTGLNTWYEAFVRTDTRADGILIGCLLAHLWMRGREPKRFVRPAAWVAAAFLVGCMIWVDTTGPFLFRGGLVGIDLACAIILLALIQGDWGARHLFRLKPFIMLGVVSYSFYLWHLLVFSGIREWADEYPGWIKIVMAVVITLAFTLASWYLIERPLLEWKDRKEGRPGEKRYHWSTIAGFKPRPEKPEKQARPSRPSRSRRAAKGGDGGKPLGIAADYQGPATGGGPATRSVSPDTKLAAPDTRNNTG